MDNIIEINNLTHKISINERKSIAITGIKKIISFDKEEFLLDSTMGIILIKGHNLEMIKLDTHEGNVSIKGKINGINYTDDKNKTKDTSLLSKLFK